MSQLQGVSVLCLLGLSLFSCRAPFLGGFAKLLAHRGAARHALTGSSEGSRAELIFLGQIRAICTISASCRLRFCPLFIVLRDVHWMVPSGAGAGAAAPTPSPSPRLSPCSSPKFPWESPGRARRDHPRVGRAFSQSTQVHLVSIYSEPKTQ